MRSTGRTIAKLVAVAASFALAFAACGDDRDDATAEPVSSETTEAGPSETTATESPRTTDADETEAAPDDVTIELTEWSISDPGELAPGTITFAINNIGANTHALAIARGVRYEELPLRENGAVDTDSLGDDFLGASDNLQSGATGTAEFELEAGDYVFFCPIEFGPNSHAGAGQVLGVTVGG